MKRIIPLRLRSLSPITSACQWSLIRDKVFFFCAGLFDMQQVVTKFGGTSVSSLQTWENIAAITKQHLANGVQPVIVCSALTQASNKLEKAIEAALLNQHQNIEADIAQRYVELASALQVSAELISTDLEQLKQWLTGIALLKEAPAKTRAQILSLGELMMTRLGHAFLRNKGINCLWFDVREALVSTPIPGGDAVNFLAARCNSEPKPELRKIYSTVVLKPSLLKVFLRPIHKAILCCWGEEARIPRLHCSPPFCKRAFVKYGPMCPASIRLTPTNYPTPVC